MLLEDGAFGKHLMTPEVLMSLIWPLTLIILAFIFCMFYLVLELIRKPDTEKSNIHVYIRPMINSRISSRRQKVSKVKQSGACQFGFSEIGDSSNNNNNNSVKNEHQQPKRKPKMSSSGKKEKEKLFQESHAVQLLSQIYDVTKSLLNETREVIKKFDQKEETSKNSTECIKTELEARQKEKESQLLFLGNLSLGEAPESLKGLPACINQTNSHGSHSSNTLDSKAGEKTKDYGDVPKEISPLLKNNSSLRHITYHFNEIQSPTASNTNTNGSNISTITSIFTSFALIISLLLLKSGNEAATVKNTYYINNEKNVISVGDKNSNLAFLYKKNKDIKVDQSQNSSTPVATAAGGIAGTHDPKYQTLSGMRQECFGADKAASGSGGGGAPTGGPVAPAVGGMAGTHDPNY